ncbi:Sec23/Sec24 trunk domain-containing protein [Infundibulicybe gibba]|nr:Sec23/Sec24 trunk domain-containing protein [Infundibulicybe gibba]
MICCCSVEDQVPSPTDAIEADRQEWENQVFMTLPGKRVPLATTDFTAVDQGNSSPKYVRVSTWNFPHTPRLAHDCHIPLIAVFQPFADLDPREEPVPVVPLEPHSSGPPRCERCRSYINPWCTWTGGGNRWKCNLCAHETEVTPEYFCNLDANLMRLDHLHRPELNKGTVDFVVPEEYWAVIRQRNDNAILHANAMNYVFALDVSAESIRSGFLRTVCSALRTALFGGTLPDNTQVDPCIPPESGVAILTFDQTIHFHDLSSEKTPMMVLSDLDEVFVPRSGGIFINPSMHRPTVDSFFESLPRRFEYTSVHEAALGSCIRAAEAAFAGCGGHLIVFQSTMPTVGDGALVGQPKETELHDTDKEKLLYKPRDTTWKDIGEECAEAGIGVSMFLGMNKFIDVGSIGVVASMTGGDIFYHPRFDPIRDAITVNSQLQRLMRSTKGYNCTMRIRSSSGIQVADHYGNFLQRNPTDLEFGVLDADKAVSVLLEHVRSLDVRDYVYLQSAVVYTTVSGERRVRTCNLALQVVELAASVFQFADMDAVVCHFAREALFRMGTRKMPVIRENLTEQCSSILLGYRTNCAITSRATQLILPEAFKALPAYILAILKTKPLKARHVSADVRNYFIHRISAMNVRSLMHHLYPRLLALHDLEDTTAIPDSNGTVIFPTTMRASHIFMEAHGIYLIDNEEAVMVWVGASASPQLLRTYSGLTISWPWISSWYLFTHLSFFDINVVCGGAAPTPSVGYAALRAGAKHSKPPPGATRAGVQVFIARQNLDAAELEFSDMLAEDQNNGNMSYVDITNGGSLSDTANMRASPW